MVPDSCQSNDQYPLIVDAEHYRLRFASTGKLVSFLNAQGQEQVNTDHPGQGFFLMLNMQTEIPLSELSLLEGDLLKCSSANRTQSVYFKVTPKARYCHFQLVKLEGIPSTSVLTLHFGLNAAGHIEAFDTDYMTFVVGPEGAENDEVEHAHENALVTRSVCDNDLQVHFEFIWNRDAGNPLGGFALYAPADEDDEDETILHLWAEEGLPHPKVAEPWTVERARQWMGEWQELFAQRNQLMLEGTSLDELYEGAEWALKSGCNEIYLFTNSWRHGFMSIDQHNWELRNDIYPNGESDLRAYSDYLSERGIRLNIHYVSGGLGPEDPMYVVKPDERLASYGEFELVEDISASETTIRVKPLHGLELPYLLDNTAAYARMPGMYRRMFDFHQVRIGDEIVQVGEFLDTDSDVWTLSNCTRSTNTVESAHSVDAPVKGLITAYRRMKLPDNDSTLLAEVAKGYASLLNNCRIWHTEYDGCEIHNYTGNWGFQKFASIVYENLDHPVTAHDSGAVRPKCHIEYRLNSTRRLMEGNCPYSHGNYSVPFTLDTNSRPAVSRLDTHYTLSQGYKGGALGLAKPEPMFGLRPSQMAAHGQIEELMEVLKTWRDVAAQLTPDQRALIEDSFQYLPERYERSRHLASKNVFVAERREGDLVLVPTAVLTRDVGDPLWIHGQEHGAIAPKQYVKLNDELTLDNPHAEQVPGFVIRIAQRYDYDLPTKSAFDFQDIAGQAEDLVDIFEAGNTADEGVKALAIEGNMLLDPSGDDFSGQSLTRVEAIDDGYVYEAQNPVNEEYFEAYKLPKFECRANMAHHRGIGMVIEGDGSGAVFAIQIAGRDYVVPIDFTGEKYVEILNGEVSWHEERWGWRMATKRTRYSMVSWFRTGFCRVPAHTTAKIKVRGIKLLKELHEPLQEITVSNRTGSLRIAGPFASGDYIEYDGGDTATISDGNFRRKDVVPVQRTDFVAPAGKDTYAFSGDQATWVEVQLTTRGDAVVVGNKKEVAT